MTGEPTTCPGCEGERVKRRWGPPWLAKERARKIGGPWVDYWCRKCEWGEVHHASE